jgi:hypothetical protein
MKSLDLDLMRQNRFILALALALPLVVANPVVLHATPVYLRLDSQFASGNHQKSWLEAHTKQVQFQRWLRVSVKTNSSGRTKAPLKYGWLPEDYLLTPLKLVGEASLVDQTPLRHEMQMDSSFHQMLAKNTSVTVLEVRGSWAYVNPLPASEHRPSWIPTENLKALAQSQNQKGFVYLRSPLFAGPSASSRRLGEQRAGRYVQIISRNGDWFQITTGSGTAWLKHSGLWVFEDLGPHGVRTVIANAPLRSSPLPYSDVIENLNPDAVLTVIDTKIQRWGQVHVSQTGDLWWPIADDGADDSSDSKPGQGLKLLTKELFTRKIFDMASSAAIPQLKFASAQGVFRTMDGEEWSKIPLFKNENYPIAIAGLGPVFVGPYVSEDQGETFQTWIRYDKLVATLKSKWVITPRSLQILEIKPDDAAGKKLTLKLNIGLTETVRASTTDQGRTWRAL